MTWAYNQIDVYLSGNDNILGEASVDTSSWVPLSTYGLLRSRPALTPSTVEGDSISISGKDGKRLSVINQRTNAKLKIDILLVDAWPFADLKQQGIMIRDRMNIIKSYVMDAKRIAYKAPGREPNSYYEIIKSTMTLTDADEKAMTMEVEFELYPFEFYFVGNLATAIAPQSSAAISNQFPFDTCYPIIQLSSAGRSKTASLVVSYGGTSSTITYAGPTTQDAPSSVTLDVGRELAYYTTNSGYKNANKYFDGVYANAKIPKNETVTFTNNSTDPMIIYPRKGLKT